jgi:hypothetical protein
MSVHHSQLFALLFNEQRWQELDNALTQTRETLRDSGEGNLWLFWKAASTAAQGDLVQANTFIEDLPEDQAISARQMFAMAYAKQSGDWSAPIDLLSERWKSTNAVSDLMNLCSVQLAANNSDFVADHAEELVQGMLTVDALRIAVTAAVKSKRWALCLRLLDANLGLFAKKNLPSDLRRIRITAEQASGMMLDALRHAEELVTEEENAPNLDLLFQVQIQAGRLTSAISPVQKLVSLPDTPPETLVRIARGIRLEDPNLASAALEKAVKRGISDAQTVSTAYVLAHELGLKELVLKLNPQFAAIANTPNPYLRMTDLDTTIELLRQSQQNAQQALIQWRHGRVPIHFLRRGISTPLALWPIKALKADTRFALAQSHFPVFFRHGARPILPPSRTIRRLYVDITSLLNAYELGILSLVEDVFGEIFIPPALRASLVQQLDDITAGQPEVEQGNRIVAQLLEQNKIEIWNSTHEPFRGTNTPKRPEIDRSFALNEAKRREGILVGYWQKDSPECDPPVDDRPFIASATDIVTALRDLGRLSESEANAATEQLQEASQLAGQSSRLRPELPILLDGIIAELLARAGILPIAAETFKLTVPSNTADWVRNEVRKREDRDLVSTELNELLQYLQLKSKIVDFLLKHEVPVSEESRLDDAAELSLEQLLRAEAGEGHWIWLDDRYLNAYDRCGELPIISTLGILDELRRIGRLADTEYFDLRHRLRAADFRFVPFTHEELTHHLLRAKIVDGALTETPELVILRRYFALTLLDKGSLQWPPIDFETPRPQGEIEYLIHAMQAVSDSIVNIFGKRTESLEITISRADWLRRWLWMPPETITAAFGPAHRAGENSLPQGRTPEGIGDMILLSKAINRAAFEPLENRAEYLTWVESALLPDEARQQAAAEQIRTMLEGKVLKLGRAKLERQINAAVLTEWYLALPRALRRRIDLTPSTRSSLGIAIGQSVAIGSDSFDTVKFWEAAEMAFDGKSVKIETLNKEKLFQFVLEHEPDGMPALYIRDEGQKQQSRIKDDILILLDSNLARRSEIFERHPEWTDSSSAKSKRGTKNIVRHKSALERIHRVEELRDGSAWHFYLNLERTFGGEQGPSLDSMAPPAAENLRHFLRFEELNDSISPAEFDASGRRMLKGLGVREAIRRTALFPRDIPDAVLRAFDMLSQPDKEATISNLSLPTNHPLGRAQAIRLLVRLGRQDDALKLAQSVLSEETAISTAAFLQVLHWSWNQLGVPPHAGRTNPAERLLFSWVHAGHLFNFVRAVSPPSSITDFFKKHDNTPRSEFLVSPPNEADIAWSRHLDPKQLLLTAVASALEAEGANSNSVASGIQAIVSEWCFQQQGDLRWPHLPWLHDPALYSNTTNSFLGKPRDQLLARILGREAASELSSHRLFGEMEALVSALEKEPGTDPAWILLGALLRGHQCSPALQERFKALLRIDISQLNLSEIARQTAVLVFANQAWDLGGPEFASLAQTQIAKLAAMFAKESPSPAEQKRQQHLVIQATQALSRHAPEAEAVRIFADAAVAALDSWPAIIETLADACDTLLSLPPRQLNAVAGLLARIRYSAN